MSVILLAGRKKAIAQKEKKEIRKAGCVTCPFTPGEETAGWKVRLNNKDVKICFSRDSMVVTVDGVCIGCQAFVTDEGYDLDLLFNVEGYEGHIYSDVEGTDMTNYLFLDNKLMAQHTLKDCISQHKPGAGNTKS